MTLNQLITIAGLVVSCITALIVAYSHRKQLRQIELFRLDPSVGLLPPPSPPVAFFKEYGGLIVGVGVPVLSLAWLITMNNPVTVGSVTLISSYFALILINLHFHSELRLLKYFLKLITVNEQVLRILETRRCETEAVAARLAKLENLVKDNSS
jgi:hypothetical protein